MLIIKQRECLHEFSDSPRSDHGAWNVIREYIVEDDMSLPSVIERLKGHLGNAY